MPEDKEPIVLGTPHHIDWFGNYQKVFGVLESIYLDSLTKPGEQSEEIQKKFKELFPEY